MSTIHHFVHADLDAFFASVEQLDNPSYRGKPVIVGGLPGERRSVVATASYEARKFGVHSAMPTVEAYRLCPQGIFVHGRMERYHELSSQIMDIFRTYSPDVDQMSVDEAFIDLTGTESLFGNPADTVMKLKKEVKEKTGLTVSAGLACTKYIAKISSGISKPDGFFEVKPGDEEKFMLSLPLSKVWGIGDKTLERIRNAGLFTTADVHEKSSELLSIMFGEATGLFLYKAVRGCEAETFTRDASSKSLSSETTFPFDLTDSYAAETAVMDMCHTVMFRMLREKVSSRTVMVKIRYDDFTTVSIRETAQNDITSVDDLYSRACMLFERKYETGRGIRLLGVGAENLSDTGAPHQQELFDFGEKKKQAVEKAILGLEQKHPEVKIHKARLLLPVILALFLIPNETYGDSVSSSSAGTIITNENSLTPPSTDLPALFNADIGSANVEFLAEGYWNAELIHTTSSSFGYGNPFALSISVPVFKQQVDLSLWFMLNKSFYFRSSFADEFKKNTVAAGYHGKGVLKEALAANRGIVFPSSYSVSVFGRGIGGGDNQAPGVSFRFEDPTDGRWHADAVFRYDMLKQHDALFYGKNKSATSLINPENYLSGQLFVLPSSDDVTSVHDIYVESSSGTYSDASGRLYRKLSSSEYLLLPARYMVILASDAGSSVQNGHLPNVVFTFNSRTKSEIGSELGTYTSGEDSFLGHIQTYFGSLSSSDAPSLDDYAYMHHSQDLYYGMFTTIDGAEGLIVQSSAGFSPFICAYRYDCGTAAPSDVSVISGSSEKVSSDYSAVISGTDSAFVSNDFFSDTHTYSDIFPSSSSGSQSALLPAIRYPFADRVPEFYLGIPSSSDLKLCSRTYTAVSRFDIGTDASSGSVTVYKNGIIDQGAKYDSESGSVTLSSSVSSTDKIYITWYEDSGSAEDGALAAAVGFDYTFLPGFDADISFASRWSLALSKKYADSSTAAPGFITAAAGATYSADGLLLSNTSAASFQTSNVTGLYLALAMNDSIDQTYYLGSGDGIALPSDFTPSLNVHSGDSSSFPSLSASGNCLSGSTSAVTVSGISGYAVPVEWNASSSSSEHPWASCASDLSSGSLLSSGTKFTIAMKSADTSVTGYDVYLQLGIDASSSSSDLVKETRTKVPTWKVSDSSSYGVLQSFDRTIDGWQKISVMLTDEDRSRFTEYHDARIIIVDTSKSKGLVYIGPYETAVQSVFTSHDSSVSVTSEQEADNSVPEYSKFTSGTNYTENVTWKTENTPSDTPLVISRYFDEADISEYKTVNMYFSYAASAPSTASAAQDESLVFTLDSGARSVTDTGSIAVRAVISQNVFQSYVSSSRSYHLLSISLADKTVSIDGQRISASVSINTSVVPSRLRLDVNTQIGETRYDKGEFTFDNLYFDGLSPDFLLQNMTKASYRKDGAVFSIGDFPLLENVKASSSVSETGTFGTVSSSAKQLIDASASFSATAATISITGDTALSSSESNGVSSAGYSAATTVPLLGFLSLDHSYRFDHAASSLDRSDKASLDFRRIFIPLSLSAYAQSSSTLWSLTQKTGSSAVFTLGGTSWSTVLSAETAAAQKILPSASGAPACSTETFSSGFIDSTNLAYSSGSGAASLRTDTSTAKLELRVPFASFSPQFTYTLGGKYASSSSTLFTDISSFITAFPFTIGSHTLSFTWTKEGTGTSSCVKGGSYVSDYASSFSSPSSRSWFYTAAPFADLFSTDLSAAVLADTSMTSSSADALGYSTKYEISWKRPLMSSYKDFFIPSTASAAVERDIRTSSSTADVYQIKTTLTSQSFNVFGSESVMRLMKWYLQDEYISSASAAFKIPHDDPKSMTFTVSGYMQGNFYISDTDILKAGADIKIGTDGDWSTEETLVWKRSSSFSLIPPLVRLFWKKYDPSSAAITRTSSADMTLSYADSVFKQVYVLSSSVDVKIMKYVTTYFGLSGSYTDTRNKSMLLALTATVGCKVSF